MEFVSGISIRNIFLDNDNWTRFHTQFSKKMRPSIIENVTKVLTCKTASLGFHLWECLECGISLMVPHTCKSRFCSSCGKKTTEQWIQKQLDVLPQVPWQHITFTVPAEFREFFWLNRYLLNLIIPIPAAIITELAEKKKVIPGIFTVPHTFGRDLKNNVHFHLSMTVGGLSLDHTRWISTLYLHHQPIKDMWKTRIIALFRKCYKANKLILPASMDHIKNITAFNSWLNFLYHKQWVVHLGKPTKNHKRNSNYSPPNDINISKKA